MNKENVQIFRRKVKELIKEVGLSPVEVLFVIDPLAEHMRKKSRENVENGVREFVRSKPALKKKYDV